ncbi:MAG: hypothetical protein D6675_05370 [Gemmatimonadetes bacterium]|nr:MAG: hypothetical protein D6675_05370 [Gemmatimonadota bacterium]
MEDISAKTLKNRNRGIVLAVLIGGFFILRDFYLHAVRFLPELGVAGYLMHPIFCHKISELIIAGSWLFVAFMANHERARRYPSWMPPDRYQTVLKFTGIANLVAVILATYAWTVVNLGTSPSTTNFTPLVFRENGWVWRYYLALLIIAAALHVIFVGHKSARTG